MGKWSICCGSEATRKLRSASKSSGINWRVTTSSRCYAGMPSDSFIKRHATRDTPTSAPSIPKSFLRERPGLSSLGMALKFGTICAGLAIVVSAAASAQELPRGEIVDDVQCQRDASQRYALYLPSYFNP